MSIDPARHYLARGKRQSVLLIGFSQGADVLPFVVNRLPAATRERLRMVALLSLSQTAVFEFHLQNWLGGDEDAMPVEPELRKMKGVRALCVYGEDDEDSMCDAARGQDTAGGEAQRRPPLRWRLREPCRVDPVPSALTAGFCR